MEEKGGTSLASTDTTESPPTKTLTSITDDTEKKAEHDFDEDVKNGSRSENNIRKVQSSQAIQTDLEHPMQTDKNIHVEESPIPEDIQKRPYRETSASGLCINEETRNDLSPKTVSVHDDHLQSPNKNSENKTNTSPTTSSKAIEHVDIKDPNTIITEHQGNSGGFRRKEPDQTDVCLDVNKCFPENHIKANKDGKELSQDLDNLYDQNKSDSFVVIGNETENDQSISERDQQTHRGKNGTDKASHTGENISSLTIPNCENWKSKLLHLQKKNKNQPYQQTTTDSQK